MHYLFLFALTFLCIKISDIKYTKERCPICFGRMLLHKCGGYFIVSSIQVQKAPFKKESVACSAPNILLRLLISTEKHRMVPWPLYHSGAVIAASSTSWPIPFILHALWLFLAQVWGT